MSFDFDKVIERKNTNCEKWNLPEENILPMWVADMDFEVAPPIFEAVKKRALHGIYGYTKISDEYYESIISWVKKRHAWEIKRDWIVFSPGVVPGINNIIKAITQIGDKVVVQTPVYYPFFRAIENNGRRILKNPLKYTDKGFEMDFEDLENKLKDERTKALILCSPHNPVGRVWTEEELRRLGELCIENGVTIISDEIHFDLIYKGYKHISFAAISEEFKENSITCIAPSKTFNLAGLQTSSLIIPNKSLRRKVINVLQTSGPMWPNVFGIEASIAAYREGEQWLDELLDYLKENLEFMKKYIKEKLPKVKIIEPEGTYLVWLDFNEYNMKPKELHDFMLKKAKVWFDEGYIFGDEGSGFERINIACPRSILKEALGRIKEALE